MCAVSDSIKRSWDESIYFRSFGTLWYGLVENEKKILSLARVSYIVTWRKTFKTSRSKGLSDVLLLIRLLFTVPFSKAKLERMFSRLKRVKTNFRCSHSNVWKIF